MLNMKNLYFLVLILTAQVFIGLINSYYVFYLPLFQISVFILTIIFLKYNIHLNYFFKYFSYSFILFIFYLFNLVLFDKVIFFILLTPISIYFASVFYNKSIYSKLLCLVVVYIYSLFSATILLSNLFHYNNYKKEFNKEIICKLYDNNNKILNLDKSKIYVLDFWTTSCGTCIEKFPNFNTLCVKYSKNKNIIFYSINVKLKNDDKLKTINFIQDKNYCFNNLFIDDLNDAKKLSVHDFPTILIIKNNKIVYNGYPSYDNYVIFNNIDNLVETYLK